MSVFFNFEDFVLEDFQLENLLTSGVPFKLYLLEEIVESKENKTIELIKQKAQFSVDPLIDLEANLVSKEHPIVLVCSKGKRSKKVIKKMSRLEYKNIFFIKNGYLSLL